MIVTRIAQFRPSDIFDSGIFDSDIFHSNPDGRFWGVWKNKVWYVFLTISSVKIGN